MSSPDESCGNSSDFEYAGGVQAWHYMHTHGEVAFPPPNAELEDYEEADLDIGLPKMTAV
jgi:hypothetical protein